MSWALALLFVSVAAGCGEPPVVVSPNGSAELRVSLSQTLAPTDVRGVRVEVRGPGIVTPLTTELTQVGGLWQGTVANIPAGTDRIIDGFAYDAASVVLYKGSTSSITIAADATASVNLVLQPVNPPVPYENEAPVIESLVVSANQVRPGGTITLSATARDPNGDALSFLWSAPAGTFNTAATPSTTWTAPLTTGVQVVRLQVTDARGTSTSVSIEILVQRDGATGSAQVTIGFNTWPEVRSMQGAPSTLAPGKTTGLSVTAVDPDGDALSYVWGSDCRGTFSNPLTAAPTFTLESAQTTGRCSFFVEVMDSKRAVNRGTLVLQVGNGPFINVAPRVDAVNLSSTLAGPGEVVTASLSAHDPDGKPVTFSWSATSGTVRATRWTNTSAEADWMAPACFDAPITVVATVTDADGASTQQAFTISPRESAKCGALAVSGVRNTHHILADGSVQTVPVDLTTSTLRAWVPTVDGSGYEERVGMGLANGTFVIPNVERLPFLLQVSPTSYLWVNSRTLDLSFADLGRPGVAQEPAGTQLTFALDGLLPWQDTDDLELHGTNVGIDYFSGTCAFPYEPPLAGDTSYTDTIDYVSALRTCGNVPARLDPAQGDFLYATQLSTRNDPDSGIPPGVEFLELRRSARVVPVVADGGTDGGTAPTLVLKGTLLPVPTQPQAIDFRASEYEALALAANPGAPLSLDSLWVSTLPRYLEYGQYAGFPDLALVNNWQPGQGDLSLNLEYGNPYPREWPRIITAQATVRMQFAADLADGGVATPTRFSASASTQTVLVDGTRPTIAPRVGPAQDLRINGQPTTGTGKLTGVGLTPVVSWRPPALGIATNYGVRVYELVATSTGGTSRVSVAGFRTSQTQLRLPPGVLVAGKTYFLLFTTNFEPGYEPSTPYKYGPEADYVTMFTGKFQP
jgi:acyl-CoA thioesterase FadM